MLDLVSKAVVVRDLIAYQHKCFSTIGHEETFDAIDHIIKGVMDMPTVGAVPVVHGHWEKCNEVHVEFPDGFKGTIYDAKCSVCGHLQNPSVMEQYGQLHFDYCPRCGAIMDEVTE